MLSFGFNFYNVDLQNLPLRERTKSFLFMSYQLQREKKKIIILQGSVSVILLIKEYIRRNVNMHTFMYSIESRTSNFLNATRYTNAKELLLF